MTPSRPDDGQPLVVYFSRTGNTRRLAARVETYLCETPGATVPAVERIRPTRARSYPNWLLRSAVPGSRVAIEPPEVDPREYDAVFLGTPKWTLSCPPVTEYLRRTPLAGATVGLFMTFGGFDERRYLRTLAAALREEGATVPATLAVTRDRVPDTDAEIDADADNGAGADIDADPALDADGEVDAEMARFCDRVLAAASGR